VVSKVGDTAPPGGGEAEMGDWGAMKQKLAVGGDRRPTDPVNNYISVVVLTLSDQMS